MQLRSIRYFSVEKLWSAITDCEEIHDNPFTEPHDKTCESCEAVVTIFKVLTGLLERMKENVPAVKYNQLLYTLRKNEFHVNTFKGYKMRTRITREAWSNLKQKSDSMNTAFMLFDFPMKFFLKQNRGTTVGWFGKVRYGINLITKTNFL